MTTFRIGPHGEILESSPQAPQLNYGDLTDLFPHRQKSTAVLKDGLVAQNQHSVRFDDPQLDKILSGPLPEHKLKITGLPAEAKVNYWVDSKGYFLWFEGKDIQPKAHYITNDLKEVEWNGNHNDMDKTRTVTRDAYMAKHGQPLSSFYESLDRQNDTFGYAWRMSQLAQDTLAKEESFLSKAASSSQNPYLNLFLCDVLIAQSMQPLIEQVRSHQPVDLNNPQTTAKLQEALVQAQKAQLLSNAEIINRPGYPRGNTIMPLYPLCEPGNPRAYEYYWGGSLCQAQQRELAIRWFQTLIQTGMLTNMLNKWELP